MGVITAVSFLALVATTAVFIDVNVHNNKFSDGIIGRSLKTYGGYEYGEAMYDGTLHALEWAKTNGTVYLNSTAEYLKPYERLGRDLCKISFNIAKRVYYNVSSFLVEKYPIAEYWYCYYLGFCLLPGPIAGFIQAHSLLTHLSTMMPSTKAEKNLPVIRDSLYSALAATKDGAIIAIETIKTQSAKGAEYLKTNVFVGTLAPENIQKVTIEAFNSTQVLAKNTLSWVYEKVKTMTKDFS